MIRVLLAVWYYIARHVQLNEFLLRKARRLYDGLYRHAEFQKVPCCLELGFRTAFFKTLFEASLFTFLLGESHGIHPVVLVQDAFPVSFLLLLRQPRYLRSPEEHLEHPVLQFFRSLIKPPQVLQQI